MEVLSHVLMPSRRSVDADWALVDAQNVGSNRTPDDSRRVTRVTRFARKQWRICGFAPFGLGVCNGRGLSEVVNAVPTGLLLRVAVPFYSKRTYELRPRMKATTSAVPETGEPHTPRPRRNTV